MFIKKGQVKRGSIFVETAIVLPFFLLAIVSMSLLIRVTAVEENTMSSFASQGQKYAKEMYSTELNLALHDGLHENRILENLGEGQAAMLKNVCLDRHYDIFADPHIVKAILSYQLEIPLPLAFNRELKIEQHLLFRNFVGVDNYDNPMGFDAMESEDRASSVYVFPRAGEKYHSKDCRLIDMYPLEKVLSRDIMRRYRPCKLCKAESLPPGCLVYCFDKSGKVYHKGTCPIVERYVIEMDRDEAIEKGYTPCYFCGGGGGDE